MKANKIKFEHNGKEHILWSWKGDYWNLQSGAETGVYVYDRSIKNISQYNAIDVNMPMTLSLYYIRDDGEIDSIRIISQDRDKLIFDDKNCTVWIIF